MIQLLQAINTAQQKEIADSIAVKEARITEVLTNSTPAEIVQLLVNKAIEFGLKVLAALVIYFIGAWLIRKIKKLVARGFEKKGSEPTLVSFVNSFVSIMLWVVLILIMVSTLGINTTSLAALLAAGGVAIGMALSGTLQNFAGGIMLLVFKPFKVGDYIEAQGYAGFVESMNIVSTKIRTIDNRLVTIPHGTLANGNIDNYSAKELRRVDKMVSVEYGSDVEEVKSIILEILDSHPKTLDSTTPGAGDPMVRLRELGGSSIDFVVRVWTKASDYWEVYYDITEAIYKKLPEKGISFPFQQFDVHIKN